MQNKELSNSKHNPLSLIIFHKYQNLFTEIDF